jgi:hypothetical protein
MKIPTTATKVVGIRWQIWLKPKFNIAPLSAHVTAVDAQVIWS